MKIILSLIFAFVIISCSKQKGTTDLPISDQYFTCEIDGFKGSVTSPNDSLGCIRTGTRSIIGGDANNNSDFFILTFNSDRVPGNYKAAICDISLNNKKYSSQQHDIQIKVSSFGNNGEKIVGSYSGTINQSSITHKVKGDFKLIIK
jgi:hypothetical protein